MLIKGIPALGILFDIDLLEDTWYGKAAWDLFLDLIDVRKEAPKSFLCSGDTIATLCRAENNYCIAIQNRSAEVLSRIRRTLTDSPRFRKVNPSCRFIEGTGLYSEPLPEVRFVSGDGRLIGFPSSCESHDFIGFDGFTR